MSVVEMVPEQTVVTIARGRHVVAGYHRHGRAHRLAGRRQRRLPLRNHLHSDCEDGVEEEELYANPNDVGEVAFGSRSGEAVTAETQQNHAEPGGEIRFDKSEKELDGHNQESGSDR